MGDLLEEQKLAEDGFIDPGRVPPKYSRLFFAQVQLVWTTPSTAGTASIGTFAGRQHPR